MSDRVFPRRWKELPGLDEWIWKKVNEKEFQYGAFAFEIQVRQSSFVGNTLEFGYYLAIRETEMGEPEMDGHRSLNRGPGRELLVAGYSLAHHILEEDVRYFELKVSWEELQGIMASYQSSEERTPA